MKMTMAGKIALFMNLALSVIFAFWGFGIYSQRINWTDKKIGEREGEYAKRVTEIEELVNQEKALTEQLGDGKVRGLRFDLAQQQLAEKKSLDEQEYLQPLLYNSMVEQQSLEDRQKAFEAAVKRLQTSSVVKQP